MLYIIQTIAGIKALIQLTCLGQISSRLVHIGNSVTNANNSTQSVTAYFPNYSNAAYVKVFLWDSLNGVKPLTSGEKIGEIK